MEFFFKRAVYFLLYFSVCNFSFAQPTFKHWDFRFGGSKDDSPTSFEQTGDGGFLIGGTSVSGISGDKTQPNWDPGLIGSDFWVLRLDSLGVKLWDKRFGGVNSEILVDLISTADGGFLLAGNSFSGASGDKSQPNWDVNQQTYDYWILKSNANGIKQWDKRFGGNSLELLGGVVQTSDNGYILAGASFSGISGDKTQASQGSWDYWVLRIDSLGNKIWDKRYGGTDDDFATSITINQNGGILIGGYSQSLAGGDKSQFCQGQWDYWVVRIDLNGNLLWDRTFGGNYTDWLFDMTATSDGGYVLAGQSFSENTGDKTEPNHDPTPSSSDRWIVKIDDSGNKIWDRTIGGTETEDLRRIIESIDGGFVLSGESYSPISGNKTESNLGVEQTWVVKTDSTGIPVWDKTIFSNGHDEEGT
ncbi:MAG: T9SS C-terminal target domain-containing protein, partial [Bacteroidota bacterium]